LLTSTTGATPVLAFLRTHGDETVLVVHNLSDTFAVGGPWGFSASGFDRLFADAGVADPSGGSGNWRVALPPRDSGIWRLR
jgi:hypothetical protein